MTKEMKSDSSSPSLNIDEELAKLKAQLDAEKIREREADDRIAEILAANADIPRQLNLVISRMRSKLSLIESDATQLSSSLSVTSVLAENVSCKVRDLDVAKRHVVDCLQRVEDLQDLKLCTEGVSSAMANEDYEAAAGHIHRFLTFDKALFEINDDQLDISTAPSSPGSPVSPENGAGGLTAAYKILLQAESELKGIIEGKFDEAVADGDVASMERMFKIFPQLNQHELGIQKFGTYLRSKVKEAADKNYETMIAGGSDKSRGNVLFADGLTLLFEGVARVIEIHQPLVESYYGPDKMLSLAKCLQEECDTQAERVISEFVRVRQYGSKAKLVDTYNRQPSKYAQLEKMDPLELDVLLSEVTLLHTRGELYLRFVRRKVGGDLAKMTDGDEKKEKMTELSKLLGGCALNRRMQELIGHYIAMEHYYMEESIRKAVQTDTPNEDTQTSSMVDDVFYIIRKCVRRSLSSSSVDCVCATLNNATTLLDTFYVALLKSLLKDGYPSTGTFTEVAQSYSNLIQMGKTSVSAPNGPGNLITEGEKGRKAFLLALNNAQASVQCLIDMRDTLEVDIKKHLGVTSSVDREPAAGESKPERNSSEATWVKVEHCLGLVTDVCNKMKDTAKFGIDQLINAAVKPHIRTSMEGFLDYTHSPCEEEFNDYEANDPFVQSFMTSLDTTLNNLHPLLTENNYQDLLIAVSVECALQMEKFIRNVSFNRLGGLQLDKEIRELTNYLTGVAGWIVREKFNRVSQISNLLNVESVAEAKDLYIASSAASSGSASSAGVGGSASCVRLTPLEVKQLLQLRMDLSTDAVKQLQL